MGIPKADDEANGRAVLALVAHDGKKADLLQLASRYRSTLSNVRLLATGHTGGQLSDELGLEVERVHSGPEGGDIEIGARIVAGDVDAVVFLRDPLDGAPARAGHPGAAEGLRRARRAGRHEPRLRGDPAAVVVAGDVVGPRRRRSRCTPAPERPPAQPTTITPTGDQPEDAPVRDLPQPRPEAIRPHAPRFGTTPVRVVDAARPGRPRDRRRAACSTSKANPVGATTSSTTSAVNAWVFVVPFDGGRTSARRRGRSHHRSLRAACRSPGRCPPPRTGTRSWLDLDLAGVVQPHPGVVRGGVRAPTKSHSTVPPWDTTTIDGRKYSVFASRRGPATAEEEPRRRARRAPRDDREAGDDGRDDSCGTAPRTCIGRPRGRP